MYHASMVRLADKQIRDQSGQLPSDCPFYSNKMSRVPIQDMTARWGVSILRPRLVMSVPLRAKHNQA